jgi:serine protease Do
MRTLKNDIVAMAILICWTALFFLPLPTLALDDAPKKSDEQPFLDLHAFAQHFADEVGRLKEEGKTVPSEKLVEQADQQRAYPFAAEPDPGKKLEPEILYKQTKPGVVVVGGIYKCTKCQHWHPQSSSGFVLRKDGIILTNLHVVEAWKKLEATGVMTDDGRVFPVKEVLASSRLNDLAIVKVDAEGLHPLPVAGDAMVGETVYCLSHPSLTGGNGNGFFAFSKGIVCGKFLIHNDKQAVKVLGVTVEYGPGSSGGPILNEHGAVVAVACQAIPLGKQELEKGTQMVWRLSRPSCSILDLLSKTTAEPKPADSKPADPKPAADPPSTGGSKQ